MSTRKMNVKRPGILASRQTANSGSVTHALLQALVITMVTGLPVYSEPDLVTSDSLFSGFSETCPQKIIYRPTARVSQAEHDENGNEVIVLDPSLKSPAERNRRIFLAAHECAHHLFGHTSVEGLIERRYVIGMISKQELMADCWAAEYLGRLGQGGDMAAIAESFYRRGRLYAVNGYPSGIERALTVRRCWRKGQKTRMEAKSPSDESASLSGRSD